MTRIERLNRVACAALGAATVAAIAVSCGAAQADAGTPANGWTPLGHAVWKRCDGKTAIYVFDATSSKGGIAVTSWSSECP